MPRSRLPPFFFFSSFSFFLKPRPFRLPATSAHLRQVGGHVRRRRHAVLDLGVGDGAVLLSQVQPELTLVAEVQVAFLTLEEDRRKRRR